MLFFSGCFEDFSLSWFLEVYSYDVSGHGFPLVYPIWSSQII
jgi:hypothetical protein